MSIGALIVLLLVVGVVLYFLPADARVKQIIVAVVAVIALVVVLRVLGVGL